MEGRRMLRIFFVFSSTLAPKAVLVVPQDITGSNPSNFLIYIISMASSQKTT
jgi:hypothetical protein